VALRMDAGSIASLGGIANFDGLHWLEQPQLAGDANELSFGAWIYLLQVPEAAQPESSGSMKTIAATKISGCKYDQLRAPGWSLFVHEWGTTNRQLRMSWSDERSACHELFSQTALVPFDQWAHVGFSLSTVANRAVLYLNGQVIADTANGIGNYVTGGQALPVAQAEIAHRAIWKTTRFFVGAHMPQNDKSHAGSHIFMGSLGDMWLAHTAEQDIHQALRDMAAPANARSSSSSEVLQLYFAVGAPPTNARSGEFLEAKGVDGQGQVDVVKWAEKPMLREPEPASQEPMYPEAPKMKPLSDEELKQSWPEAWTNRFSEEDLLASQREADVWAEEVREAMRHTWHGYKRKAWGHDEVKPLSGKTRDWCRMAITMLDGLSTLWLMGLKDEFMDAAKWLDETKPPTPGKHGKHSFFEITIRAVGSLMSAWHLSKQRVFLDTAQRLAQKMLPAFQTPNGMPKSTVDVGTGESQWVSWTKNVVLAEAGTLQLEFHAISRATNDNAYALAADRSMQAVITASGARGLVPIYLSRENPTTIGNKISLGACGDSYYEYLLKHWIQTGKTKNHLKDQWKKAMSDMQSKLVLKTAGGRTFVAESNNGVRHRMDHLGCFVAGMLMLGANTLPQSEVDAAWEPLAVEITETCYQMYKRSPSGLSAEYYEFHLQAGAGQDMTIPKDAPHNLLRPEAAEAIYYMHYYTGDPKYRRMAYEMFAAFQKHCKAPYGYSSLSDVRNPRQKDEQESFWLAETLKYFYLIFAPRTAFNLEEWVLSTEAQPLPIWNNG